MMGLNHRFGISEEEEIHSDPSFRSNRLSKKEVKVVRDAVIMKLLSENDPRYGVMSSLVSPKVRSDPFSMANDPGKQFFSGLARMAGNVLGGLLGDERAYRNMGLSRKQAKLVRDAVMVAAENDPGFGKKFGKALAKESAGAAGSFVGSQVRGGDPFSLTVQNLVEMYGRDPAKGKRNWPKQNGGSLFGSDDEEIFMDDMMDF
jgi:hypothetical protein